MKNLSCQLCHMTLHTKSVKEEAVMVSPGTGAASERRASRPDPQWMFLEHNQQVKHLPTDDALSSHMTSLMLSLAFVLKGQTWYCSPNQLHYNSPLLLLNWRLNIVGLRGRYRQLVYGARAGVLLSPPAV